MKKICVIILILILTTTGCSVKKTKELTDNEKFSKEYSVSKNNPFVYINVDEAIDIIKNKTGIIFFANPDCEWCIAQAKILTETLNSRNIKKAYYLNPKKIKNKDSKKYKELLDLLGDYLEKDKNDNKYLFVPDVFFIKDKKIIGHNNDLANMNGTVKESLTDKRKKQIKRKLNNLINKYKECTNMC